MAEPLKNIFFTRESIEIMAAARKSRRVFQIREREFNNGSHALQRK